MFRRLLPIPDATRESFFLWGPRQSGKSTLLKARFPDALRIDLLSTDAFARYASRPGLLADDLRAEPSDRLVIIDEVQKVPALLDEVHRAIEDQRRVFALCGSSARKLKRGQANLLGGRAVRYEMFGLVSAEIGADFDLSRALNHGLLPRHYLSDAPARMVSAYVNDYLKEEIAAEGSVRRLPTFADFLRIAAISDTELINHANIARECSVSSPTARDYFQILVDTLLGVYLPAYTSRAKRRVIQSPKFYFADLAVTKHLAKRGRLEPGSELFGKAFESFVFHELRACMQYKGTFDEIAYWRLASGIEVDFILDDVRIAIEVKSSKRITNDHLSGLRALVEDHPHVQSRIIVCTEERARRTEDGIEILPWRTFLDRLWSGNLA
jgi:uncharacterized protein